jgi:DNA polymerase IV
VKIKYANFRQITRSRTGQMPVSTRSELEQLGNALLEPLFPVVKGIRLLGISLSSLLTEKRDDKRRAADL